VRAALLIPAAAGLAACGSSPAAPTLARSATAYLLTLDRLAAPGFTVVEPARAISADTVADGDAAFTTALHGAQLQDAATARFFRSVPVLATANGPVDVSSTVMRFATAAGAHTAFAAQTTHTDAVPGMLPESAGALGDEAHADERDQTASDGTPVVEVTVTWRTTNLVSTLVVRGRQGGTRLGDALILAHSQAAGER
jgi:hypothetical protein